jgi:hypothetical protein
MEAILGMYLLEAPNSRSFSPANSAAPFSKEPAKGKMIRFLQLEKDKCFAYNKSKQDF